MAGQNIYSTFLFRSSHTPEQYLAAIWTELKSQYFERNQSIEIESGLIFVHRVLIPTSSDPPVRKLRLGDIPWKALLEWNNPCKLKQRLCHSNKCLGAFLTLSGLNLSFFFPSSQFISDSESWWNQRNSALPRSLQCEGMTLHITWFSSLLLHNLFLHLPWLCLTVRSYRLWMK